VQLGTDRTSARNWIRSLAVAGVRTARSGGAPRRPPRTPSTASATCTAAATVQESLWKRSSCPRPYRRPPRQWPSPPRRPLPPLPAAASRTIPFTRPSPAAPVEVAGPATSPARSPRRWGRRLSCTRTMLPAMHLLVVERPKISGDCSFLAFLSSPMPILFLNSALLLTDWRQRWSRT
jgi:hypothetical protein